MLPALLSCFTLAIDLHLRRQWNDHPLAPRLSDSCRAGARYDTSGHGVCTHAVTSRSSLQLPAWFVPLSGVLSQYRKYMYEKLTKCPNFTWYLHEEYFSRGHACPPCCFTYACLLRLSRENCETSWRFAVALSPGTFYCVWLCAIAIDWQRNRIWVSAIGTYAERCCSDIQQV